MANDFYRQGDFNYTDPDPMYGFRKDPFGNPLPSSPALSQVGGMTGGNKSGQPSDMDKLTMEYMLTMGQQQPALEAAAKRAELGKQLRADNSDTSGLIDSGRLKVFSAPAAIGKTIANMAGSYAQGKAGRDAEAAGGKRMDAFKALAAKRGFGSGGGLPDLPSYPTGGGLDF